MCMAVLLVLRGDSELDPDFGCDNMTGLFRLTGNFIGESSFGSGGFGGMAGGGSGGVGEGPEFSIEERRFL